MIIHQYMCECLNARVHGRYKYWEVQGLSSCIFTKGFSRIFCWLGPKGSDCGVVNIRIPNNRAEYCGAHGRETEHWGCQGVWQWSWKYYLGRIYLPWTTASTFFTPKESNFNDDASIWHRLGIPTAALKKPKKISICSEKKWSFWIFFFKKKDRKEAWVQWKSRSLWKHMSYLYLVLPS